MWHKKTNDESKLSDIKTPSISLDPETGRKYECKNNPLHQTIINNDFKSAITLIDANSENEIYLNQQSLLNTPLTLALKHGNMKIAEYLLTQTKKLDLNIRDSRGLSALEWACMLRQDEIIKMILCYNKGEDLVFDENHNNYAYILYTNPVNQKIFDIFIDQVKGYISRLRKIDEEEGNNIDVSTAAFFAESGGKPIAPITSHEPYSDLRFFMKDICINLDWMKAKDFPNEETITQSHELFYQCFLKGYKTFCQKRNALTPNFVLAEALKNQETHEAWLLKQSSSLKQQSGT